MSKISPEVQRSIEEADAGFAEGDSEQCQIILDELADIDLQLQAPDLTQTDKGRLNVQRLALGRLFHKKRCDAPAILDM